MELRRSLNELIASSAFVALEERLRNRSALHVLGIERRELSHASLLRWVLDPRANHGMGSTPIRRGIGNMNRPCPKTTTPAVPASTPASPP